MVWKHGNHVRSKDFTWFLCFRAIYMDF
jgi:hypothetical protein